jgi:hypothetical protein
MIKKVCSKSFYVNSNRHYFKNVFQSQLIKTHFCINANSSYIVNHNSRRSFANLEDWQIVQNVRRFFIIVWYTTFLSLSLKMFLNTTYSLTTRLIYDNLMYSRHYCQIHLWGQRISRNFSFTDLLYQLNLYCPFI